MTAETQLRWGILLGLAAVVVASFGILDLVGSFDDPDELVAHRTSLSELKWPLLATLPSLAATLGLVVARRAGAAVDRQSAVLVTASFIALVVSVYRVGVALGPFASDETGSARPLYERHGFWVVLVAHAPLPADDGELLAARPLGDALRRGGARNALAQRLDLDLVGAGRVVLVQAGARFLDAGAGDGSSGADWRAGRMLATVDGRTPWPEWAARMPVFIMTIVALYFLYKGVAKVFGRRAGMLGALVLATMPQWFLLAHQTMTDMPLVAALSASMGLLLLGMHTDGDRRVRSYEVTVCGTKMRLSGFHLVFGVVLLSALPQILYLCSRNVELSWLPDSPGSAFASTSSSPAPRATADCRATRLVAVSIPPSPAFQPAIQGLLWAGSLRHRALPELGRKRRSQRLYFLAAWYFAAVATMGKGPAGFGLPLWSRSSTSPPRANGPSCSASRS